MITTNNIKTMSKKQTTASGGIGFTGLLAIVFITLKLTNTISWPWLWVLAPLWTPLAVAAIIFFVALIGYVILKLNKK